MVPNGRSADPAVPGSAVYTCTRVPAGTVVPSFRLSTLLDSVTVVVCAGDTFNSPVMPAGTDHVISPAGMAGASV
jgi:hypothetical protein